LVCASHLQVIDVTVIAAHKYHRLGRVHHKVVSGKQRSTRAEIITAAQILPGRWTQRQQRAKIITAVQTWRIPPGRWTQWQPLVDRYIVTVQIHHSLWGTGEVQLRLTSTPARGASVLRASSRELERSSELALTALSSRERVRPVVHVVVNKIKVFIYRRLGTGRHVR
jgi:hypothetical protein